MTITFPTLKQLDERIKTDVQNTLDETNPFLRQSYIGALITGYAGRADAIYKELKELLKQLFPDTATGEFLRRWGSYVNVNPNLATEAKGPITIGGTADASVPINTVFQVSGLQYKSTVSKALSLNTLNITSITRVGTTATVTTPSPHLLASSMQVTIAGAAQSEYNGAFIISVISATQFSYTISGSPVTPATGTPTASFTGATIDLVSTGFGSAYNQPSGTALSLVTPLSGVSFTGYVQFGEISGGFDNESEEDYAIRVIERYRNPITPFNKSNINATAKQVTGVTRVFVQEATPAAGQVTVYFMRDNDEDPIPTGTEVHLVKDKLLTIKPAHTEDDDVIVSAPTPVAVNFTFTALQPDTATMRAAILANLKELFAEGTEVGVDLLADAYRGAIYRTTDIETGQVLKSFSLGTPAGDISIGSDELAVLGNVVFP